MQPIAVITAPAAGIAYINGRFAGELGSDSPLVLPVNPHGNLYLEFRPFARRWRCSAHRFSFTSGVFDTGAADGCHVVIWPGGIYEIALTPCAAVAAESEFGVIDGLSVAMLRGEASMLRVGAGSIALPDGAVLPHSHISAGSIRLFFGKYPGGAYAAAFSSADLTPIDSITAADISFDDGQLRAITPLNDVAGHSRMETYTPASDGLELSSGEYLWADGAPRPPASASEAMLAALEAELLGLHGEARGYLAPELRKSNPLPDLVRNYDAALPLKYAPPDARPGAALVRRIAPNVAAATPVYFHARPDGGPQGLWLIDKIYAN